MLDGLAWRLDLIGVIFGLMSVRALLLLGYEIIFGSVYRLVSGRFCSAL